MEIKIAEHSGYCFGVKRAINIAEDTLKKYRPCNKRIFTLGPIIHNPGVVEELKKKGIIVAKSKEEINSGDILIIRSHGMPHQIVKELEDKGVMIIDATCPFVKRAQEKAKMLGKNGYFVVILGNKNHPEVKGIAESIQVNMKVNEVSNGKKSEYSIATSRDSNDYEDDEKKRKEKFEKRKGANFIVVEDESDLEQISPNQKIGVVAQTTQPMEKFKFLVNKLLEKGKEILVVNTICDTTKKRQISTRNLAKSVDLMLIVGGKNSANTTHLAEISKKCNPRTFHIENYREIDKNWLKGVKKIGISGGASTPLKDVMEVRKFVEGIAPTDC
ncbi:MAG: 4-hydroxy-3-methylbut-2-enyl diphosphate reductase [Actinobacteria bacterium]|nr:4-hydroxy-3-methylbut-2-enyl diphosphate reductase [Actinomycetota bacterium]